MMNIPEVNLNSAASASRSMPKIGFGTAVTSLDGDGARTAVLEAIKLGYRHFDTASLYGSEKPLGEAIAEAIQLGLIGSREELFITSKLWCSDAHSNLVLPALKTSLRNLEVEYLDLYLIHFPISAKPEMKCEYPIPEDDLLPTTRAPLIGTGNLMGNSWRKVFATSSPRECPVLSNSVSNFCSHKEFVVNTVPRGKIDASPNHFNSSLTRSKAEVLFYEIYPRGAQ